MTIVQEETLPSILKGKDVLAKDNAFTGKTTVFMFLDIEVIVKSPFLQDHKMPPIFVLVIFPTRELER